MKIVTVKMQNIKEFLEFITNDLASNIPENEYLGINLYDDDNFSIGYYDDEEQRDLEDVEDDERFYVLCIDFDSSMSIEGKNDILLTLYFSTMDDYSVDFHFEIKEPFERGMYKIKNPYYKVQEPLPKKKKTFVL